MLLQPKSKVRRFGQWTQGYHCALHSEKRQTRVGTQRYCWFSKGRWTYADYGA